MRSGCRWWELDVERCANVACGTPEELLHLEYVYGSNNNGNPREQVIRSAGMNVRQRYDYDGLNRLRQFREEPVLGLFPGNRIAGCPQFQFVELPGRNWYALLFPPTGGGGLAVGVFAIADAGDFDEVVGEVAEDDAVVLSAESVEGRLDALEALDVAFFGGEESGQGAKNLDCDGLREGAEFGFGLIGEGDALSHSCVGC